MSNDDIEEGPRTRGGNDDNEHGLDERPGPESATTSNSSNPSLGKNKVDSTTANHENEAAQGHEVSPSTSSIHTRPSRRSTIENGQGLSEKAEAEAIEQEEERGLIRRVPLFRHPVKDAERWHDSADVPSQWSPFFYGKYIPVPKN